MTPNGSANGFVYVSAGEPSGDTHAAEVVRVLKEQDNREIIGMGGPAMELAGARLTQTIDHMSAIGFAEIMSSVPRHAMHLFRTRSLWRSGKPSLAIFVDYPGYHLYLARLARRYRVPVLYYIAPQLWAWGANRVKLMRECIWHIAAILPFEEDFFCRQGIPTTFVGHPLLDRVSVPPRADARSTLGIPEGDPVLALFPGSRPTEIKRHWPVFRDTAMVLHKMVPELRVLVGAASAFAGCVADEWQVVVNDSFTTMAAADVILGKSGTTTLEAALVGRPMCIVYKMNPASYHLARRIVTCEHIGLVNLLVGRRAVPEFVQDHADVQSLTRALLPLFDRDGTEARAQLEAMSEARERLGTPGAAKRVSELALELAA